MKQIVCFLLIVSHTIFAQEVFQNHEVSQAAQPKGGTQYLQLFVMANLQMPFQARLQRVKGRVFLSGIVETDGSLTNPTIVRGLHPLCDAEALRVFRLFNAWQPAQKDGKAVRQVFNYSVVFAENPVANYDSTSRSQVVYYDQNFQYTTNAEAYIYRKIVPLDDMGVVRDNIKIEKLIKANKWQTLKTANFKRAKIAHKWPNQDSTDAYKITVMDEDWQHYVPEMIFLDNGQLISSTEYNNLTPAAYTYYFSNGVVRETQRLEDNIQRIMRWHSNGQIAEIKETTLSKPSQASNAKVLNLWDKDGNVLVANGNGTAVYTSTTHDKKTLTEMGDFKDGQKHGQWSGKLDSAFYYEETYENGKLLKGRSKINEQEYTYTDYVDKQPEFDGGIPALMIFLGSNIRYPTQAMRRNVSGKVYVSFVVCQDGSLCDYTLLKGIGEGCDEEALRVVKAMSGKWLPGQQRGQKVRVKYNLPVSFVLE
jgi:TonB family protein